MKKILVYLLAVLTTGILPAQEFKRYDNGLIYNENTMRALHHIVDSLHLRFKICEPSGHFRAKPQAKGYYIQMDSLTLQAEKDIRAGIAYDEFVKKYPFAAPAHPSLVVGYDVDTYQDIKTKADKKDLKLYIYPGEKERRIPFENDLLETNWSGKWICRPPSKDKHLRYDKFWAIYLITGFETPAFPVPYGRAIQYAECMIDTTTTTYTGQRSFRGYLGQKDKKNKLETPAQDAFFKYYKNITPDNGSTVVDAEQRETLKSLLRESIAECVAQKTENYTLENLAGLYLGSADKLTMMRLRQVVGSCSMDESPRLHAIEIAQRAAETASWEIFLRSHLDVMNDQFSRVTDGSYAWGQRGTYLHELEVLGIDVPELMIGICLKANHVAKHHYFGNISRVGRALAESAQLTDVESRLQNHIADPALDDYNRLIMFYVYQAIQYYKLEKTPTGNNSNLMERVDNAVAPVRAFLPEYLQTQK